MLTAQELANAVIAILTKEATSQDTRVELHKACLREYGLERFRAAVAHEFAALADGIDRSARRNEIALARPSYLYQLLDGSALAP